VIAIRPSATGKGKEVILILNYRAPVDQFVLEFPAGRRHMAMACHRHRPHGRAHLARRAH
jgi:hypothetical protein